MSCTAGNEINKDIHERILASGTIKLVSGACDLVLYELDVIIDFAGFGSTTAAAVVAV
jgi:alcohol dehydrogenase, propanol-preferring